jgi:hypothetical protein
VQRCYYQPVTCYQTRTYYEAVTTYRTSYYYEPVTTYRYSCYCDPCTGCCQQVACPQTCCQLRAQCCPVQSWVQRCCQVPVTSYQRAFYWEPVTTCCTPQCCPSPCASPCNGTPAPAYAAPACADAGQPAYTPPAAQAPAYNPPAVSEQRSTPVPGVQEYPDSGKGGSGSPLYDRYSNPPANPTMPGASGAYRQVPPRQPAAPAAPVPAPRPPSVRLERIVSAPLTQVQGQVVRGDSAPQAGAKVVFVSATRREPHQIVTADATGKFRVTLASGGWLVYVHDANDRPVLHSKIDLNDNENRKVTLVSR